MLNTGHVISVGDVLAALLFAFSKWKGWVTTSRTCLCHLLPAPALILSAAQRKGTPLSCAKVILKQDYAIANIMNPSPKALHLLDNYFLTW